MQNKCSKAQQKSGNMRVAVNNNKNTNMYEMWIYSQDAAISISSKPPCRWLGKEVTESSD